MMTSLKNLLWVIAIGVFVTYGIMAFNAGLTISPNTNTSSAPAAQIQTLNEQTMAGKQVIGSPEEKSIPLWGRLLARVSSDKYMYGQDSIMPTIHYYYEMGDKKRTVLSTHMMLGMLIMTCGIMQFWPAFRRKYRKAHRVFGAIYLIAGFSSMSMSCYHLMTTSIDNIYSTFVFYIGLWLMLFGSIISMTLGMYYLTKKNIALHLGWQVLGFVMFLTAPLQRLDWFLVSPLHNFGASFNEANIIVDMILFVQCLLIGYLIFCANRNSSPLKPAHTLESEHPWFSTSMKHPITLILLAAWGYITYHFILNPGMLGTTAAHVIIPESILNWEAQLFNTPWLPVLYILAISVIIFSNVYLMHVANITTQIQQRSITWMSTAALIAGGVHIYWGYLLGIPSHAHSGGGTFYMLSGTVLILFGILCFGARNIRVSLTNERRLFLLLATIAPALTYCHISFLAIFPIIPAKYLVLGHGYEIACIGGIYVPLLFGFIAAIYNQETSRYRIN